MIFSKKKKLLISLCINLNLLLSETQTRLPCTLSNSRAKTSTHNFQIGSSWESNSSLQVSTKRSQLKWHCASTGSPNPSLQVQWSAQAEGLADSAKTNTICCLCWCWFSSAGASPSPSFWSCRRRNHQLKHIYWDNLLHHLMLLKSELVTEVCFRIGPHHILKLYSNCMCLL